MKIKFTPNVTAFAIAFACWLARDWGVLSWEIHMAAALVRYGVGKIVMCVVTLGWAIDLGVALVRAWRRSGEELRRHGL